MAIVIQPHADDGAMSCGQLMAAYPKSTLITVFAGIPTTPDLLSPFDEACGFSSSAEAMSARLEEDRRACAVLDAYPVWLDNLDGQYLQEEHDLQALAETIVDALRECDPFETVFIPRGIEHPDHLAVASAARLAVGLLRLDFVVYEELPGRVLWPSDPPYHWKRSEQVAGPLYLKAAAISCYRSQTSGVLPELAPPWHSCLVEERFWEVG